MRPLQWGFFLGSCPATDSDLTLVLWEVNPCSHRQGVFHTILTATTKSHCPLGIFVTKCGLATVGSESQVGWHMAV